MSKYCTERAKLLGLYVGRLQVKGVKSPEILYDGIKWSSVKVDSGKNVENVLRPEDGIQTT